jgi:hypothetical protein
MIRKRFVDSRLVCQGRRGVNGPARGDAEVVVGALRTAQALDWGRVITSPALLPIRARTDWACHALSCLVPSRARRDPAFATLVGLYGGAARAAITGITLIAGFASTVGRPLSTLLDAHFGWRGACLARAALHLLIGLPLNRLLIPRAPPLARATQAQETAGSAPRGRCCFFPSCLPRAGSLPGQMVAQLPRLLDGLRSGVLGAPRGPRRLARR